jgi:hypothetical protein
VVTPYDALIIQLNQELNDTYIYYGSRGYSKMKLQATQDSNAAMLNEVVVVKRAVSKSSRIYNNATWDLVDASREKTFKYEDIDKKALPKTLRNKSLKELEIYVATQAKKRQEIQQKINDLDKKRRVYIAKKQSETKKDNLENAMISTIKKQAQAKNYSW